PYVDILITGEDEGKLLFNTDKLEEVLEECKSYNFPYFAIKRGENGAIGKDSTGIINYPALETRKVVDTVGAGDGFNCGFVYGVLNKWSLKKTLKLANTIGSLVISVSGDNEGLPYYDDVLTEWG